MYMSINLGKLSINNRFLLAPMALYTDIALRKLCSEYGASYTFSELTATAGFIRKQDSFKRRIDFYDDNIGIQFITNSSDELKKSINIIKNNEFYNNLENIKSIDLNLGCPSNNIISQNLGSALLNQPNKIRELFKTMNKYSHLPISAKIRLGLNSKHKRLSKPYLRIAKIAKEENLDFLTIHGRTTGQGYEGNVDLSAIEEVYNTVDIPLIGNGNITGRDTCNKMLNISDAVMIGRQAVKDPFIFKELKNPKWKYDYKKEKIKCIKKYLTYSEKYNVGFQHIKIHMQSFLKGLTNQKNLIKELTSTKNKEDIFNLLEKKNLL